MTEPIPILDLIHASARLREIDGLTDAALSWSELAEQRRPQIARAAAAASRPQLSARQVAALGDTTWRAAAAFGPHAAASLLNRGAGLFGRPRKNRRRILIDTTQQFVRAGGAPYTKLAQFTATAGGLVPREWSQAFAWAVDESPALPSEQVIAIIRRDLGPAAAQILDIGLISLGTGSIGQVHPGRLNDGREVVIKVRKPHVESEFRRDLPIIALLAGAATRLPGPTRSAGLTQLSQLFAQLVMEELDLRLEAANLVEAVAVLEQLGDGRLTAPRPIPGLVTDSVLVMERITGTAYTRAPTLPPQQGATTLRLGVDAVIHAALVHGVFHGDLHGGNVLINPDGSISLVDFGIVGRLKPHERAGLLQFLIGFAESNAQTEIRALQTFGAIPADINLQAFAEELQIELDALSRREHGPATFDRLGQTLGDVLRLLMRHHLPIPPALFLFLKNLLYLSGFASELSPDEDLLDLARDLIANLLADPQIETPRPASDHE